MKAYISLFNYTSTYRLDSDFPMVYGQVKIRKQKEVRNYDEILKKKKKLMAWFVSNCNTESRRSTFMKKHPLEYIIYINDKASIDVSTGSIKTNIDWYRFCEMLNDKRRPRKLVVDIRKWWIQRGCFEPPNITKL